jgi:hypothetical protein
LNVEVELMRVIFEVLQHGLCNHGVAACVWMTVDLEKELLTRQGSLTEERPQIHIGDVPFLQLRDEWGGQVWGFFVEE